MKTITTTIVCLAASLLLASALHADLIVDWDFSVLGTPGTDNTSVGGDAVTDDNVGVNNLLGAAYANAAAGITVTGITGGGSVWYSDGGPAAGEANLKRWDLAGAGAGTNDGYIEFTMTADVAGALNIDSISISQWRNGTGAPDGIAFDVSVDGSAFVLYDAVQLDPDFGDSVFNTFTFSQSIIGADSVAFRFTPRNVAQGHLGNLHINGLTVNGSVNAVPEPSSLVICVIIGIAGCGLRRRRKT